jgi:UDP-N-acetylglucosamine:LPS N-acetylglucosamine transferase
LEKETTAESLYKTVKDLLASPSGLNRMGENAKSLAHNDSLLHIYQTIKSIIG